MAQELDPGTRARYLHALRHWKTDTYVNFLSRPQAWIWDNLECDPREVAEAMYGYVNGGGRVMRVPENGNAEDYSDEFHDDLVFRFNEKDLYVETVFHDDRDPDGCHIDVVSVHWSRKR